MGKLKDFKKDSKNANKGTARGFEAIINSLKRSGAGRSIVVDKNGQIIGGNKTTEAAIQLFGNNAEVVVIETTGDKLIVHKRNDLDLSDNNSNNPARQLAYADNLSSWMSFDLDPDQVMADIEAGFDFEQIDISLPDLGDLLERSANSLAPTDPVNDPLAEWEGMPEFENEDKTAFRSLIVHFANQNDIEEFAKLTGQTITEKTKSIWYPKSEIETYADKVYT